MNGALQSSFVHESFWCVNDALEVHRRSVFLYNVILCDSRLAECQVDKLSLLFQFFPVR